MANVYQLRECNATLPTIYTDTLLTPGISAYLDQVVQIAGYPDNCWIVIQQAGNDSIPVYFTWPKELPSDPVIKDVLLQINPFTLSF